MVELTFREGVKLRRALRTAIPSRLALAQVVFDQMHEDLKELAGDDDYGEVLVRLIVWAEANKRTVDLIRSARIGNPGDDLLREFQVEYQAARQSAAGVPALPPRALMPVLRQTLVEAVMLIPTVDQPEVRTTFLHSLPVAPTRIPGNALADLNTIFDQLDKLGRLESGQWPLLVVIDNILPYVHGYPDISNVITNVRKTLADAYAAY